MHIHVHASLVFKISSIANTWLASFPGHAVGEVAWYLPFVHAQEFTENGQ